MNDHIKTTETRYHKNFAYFDNDHIIGQSLELYGEYGQGEINFLLWLANPSHTIYDIGANIGTYTVALASSGAKVFAFEPNPTNYSLLLKNTCELTNVQTFNIAVGNTNGIVYCDEIDLEQPGNYGAVRINDSNGIRVNMMALDKLNIPPPTMIKIDVEGYEYPVLQGLENVIEQHRPVIVYEAHETKNFAEIYHFLKKFSYRLVWLQCLNYVKDNFKKNSNNVFENTALFSVIAWPPQAPQEILTGHEVTGPEDSCERFF